MNLRLTRNAYREDGIFGSISDENGKVLFTTGEHSYPLENAFTAKIPKGVYICVRGIHNLANEPNLETFELQNVPGHTGCLLHRGNYPQQDSDGCILLGKDIGWTLGAKNKMITYSVQAFNEFIALQKDLDSFTLTID